MRSLIDTVHVPHHEGNVVHNQTEPCQELRHGVISREYLTDSKFDPHRTMTGSFRLTQDYGAFTMPMSNVRCKLRTMGAQRIWMGVAVLPPWVARSPLESYLIRMAAKDWSAGRE